jgi:hypothetical protein
MQMSEVKETKVIFNKIRAIPWRDYTGNWKPFVAGIVSVLVLIAVIFALPVKTITTNTVENYYVTETSLEPYMVVEPFIAEEVQEQTRVIADGYYTSVPLGISFPFTVQESNAHLVGSYNNPFTGTFKVIALPNKIVWEHLGSRGDIDVMLPEGEYKGVFQENIMWGQDCSIYLAIQWLETVEVTRYREVTKYRDVPVQVEKQRTITTQAKVSLWKYIFS